MFYPWDNYKLRTLSGQRKYSEFVVAKAFYTKRYSGPPRVCRGGSFARILLLFACQPNIMGKVLGIVYRTIATHLSRNAGYTKTTSNTGAVTLIQRFGSALNMKAPFTSTCCSSTVSMWTVPDPPHGFAGSRRRRTKNSINSPIPSHNALPVFWSTRGCWNPMSRTAISHWIRWIRLCRRISITTIRGEHTSPWIMTRRTVVPYEQRNLAMLLYSQPSTAFIMSIFRKLHEYSGPTGLHHHYEHLAA
jgi:hypothetical protein